MSWFTFAISAIKGLNPLRVLKLEEENAQPRHDKLSLAEQLHQAQSKLQQKAGVTYSPKGYYFQGSDSNPFCATCYETKDLRVTLEPPEE